jgi:ABC-type lipoprotein export system ATPase subunit
VQRVALARAIAAARGLLLLDEPTSRLDEASAELVATLIGQAARGGQTVICASHDPRLSEQADEVLALPAQASGVVRAVRENHGEP